MRERAMFCPECGKAFGQSEPTAAAAVSQPVSAPSSEPVARASKGSNEIAGSDRRPQTAAGPPPEHDDSAAPHGARERTREGLHRASSVARGALADNVKRVEKIQHVSSAMFEEAHYDPSLRFVLVALGLFVVFVILLILSKVMG